MSRRLRTPNPAISTLDEVIDLTIDSPVLNLGARANLPRRNRRTNSHRECLPIFDYAVQDHVPLIERFVEIPAEQDDSAIQVMDPDEPPSVVRQVENNVRSQDSTANANSVREYSSAVPCVRESFGEELLRLSCPICFEPLAAKQKPTTTLCGHIFCAECLEQSLQTTSNKTCPICNGPVRFNSCIRLHFL